jgi:hypothetical protein
MRLLKNVDLDLLPPPMKRAKTEESVSDGTLGSSISLSAFLTTPHFKTKNCLVEVSLLLFFYGLIGKSLDDHPGKLFSRV